MRSSALSSSLALHAAFFVMTAVSMPWLKKDFIIPPPITVEFVEIAKVTETTKVTPMPKKEEKKEEKKDDTPPPVAQNTSSEAVTPVPTPKKPEIKKPEVKKEKSVVLDDKALPDKKKKIDKKKIATAEPKKDFSSVLKNLAPPKSDAAVKTDAPDLKSKTTPTAGQNAPLGQRMTMSEQDALRRQLERCWNVPYGAKDAENLAVDVFMSINRDRTLRSAQIVDISRYNSDSFFRAAADSALRAVRSPLCSPFDLPDDKFETWKTITVTFNPKEMF